MWCYDCEEVTEHKVIRKDRLCSGGETAILASCKICDDEKWIIGDKEIYPYNLNIGDTF